MRAGVQIPRTQVMLSVPACRDPRIWEAETKDPQASWLVRIAEIGKLQEK